MLKSARIRSMLKLNFQNMMNIIAFCVFQCTVKLFIYCYDKSEAFILVKLFYYVMHNTVNLLKLKYK